jgi:DNA polymerase III sliding clamp (beta) subunit (PCNA family)
MTAQTISTLSRKQIWSHIDEHQLPVKKALSTEEARAALIAYYGREQVTEEVEIVVVAEPSIETTGDLDEEVTESALIPQVITAEQQQSLPTATIASLSISAGTLAKLVGNLKLSSPDTFRLSFSSKGLEVFGVSKRLTVRCLEPLTDFHGISGAVILPIAFANLVAKLPKGEQVTITIDELLNLHLTCLASTYESQGGSPENYPAPFKVAKTDILQCAVFGVADLRSSIRRTGYATKKPDTFSAEILQMIYIDLEQKQMMAVDGHRVAVSPCADIACTKTELRALTLPRPIWQAIAKLTDTGSDVTITWHEGCVVATFSDSSLQLVCTWTEQKYPAVGDIIDSIQEASSHSHTLDAADLLGKLNTVSPIVDAQKTLRLSFTADQLLIQAIGLEKGEANVSVAISGSDWRTARSFGLNCEYLREAIASFGSGSVRLNIPVTELALPISITRDGFAAYVMPVSVK